MRSELVLKQGKDATPEERAAFVELVSRDPQVDLDGLSTRVARSHLLAFLYVDGKLVGTGAIKRNRRHQSHVAQDAGTPLPESKYLGEIGYLHTEAKHRRQGHGDRILAGLIEAAKDEELFATVQSKNEPSRRLLARHGYQAEGKTWPSQRVNDKVNLYVRKPPLELNSKSVIGCDKKV